jgi:hypothetical protein
VDAHEYRRTSHEVWEAMAPGWERRRRQLAAALTLVRARLISELAPRSGEMVLERGFGLIGALRASPPVGFVVDARWTSERSLMCASGFGSGSGPREATCG